MASDQRIIAGLSEALGEYFGGQLQLQREGGGRLCPGEDICADEEHREAGPLVKYLGWDVPVDVVCRGGINPVTGDTIKRCALCVTKPGEQPAHLAAAIHDVIELNDLPENATFIYPDGLNIWQWAGLRALTRARSEDMRDAEDRRKQEAAPAPTQGSNIVGQRMIVKAD